MSAAATTTRKDHAMDHGSPRKKGTADRVREQIVEEEMELEQRADAVTLALAIGDDRLGADLEILPRPDDAGRDDAGGGVAGRRWSSPRSRLKPRLSGVAEVISTSGMSRSNGARSPTSRTWCWRNSRLYSIAKPALKTF